MSIPAAKGPITASLVTVTAALGLWSCLPVASPNMVPQELLASFQQETMRDLEQCTGLKWQPREVAFHLMRCNTQDEQGRCWRWGGHYLVGATTLGEPTPSIRICSCDLRRVHRDVVRHELLHVLLLQHGLTGHPRQYEQCAVEWDAEQDEMPATWEVNAPPRESLLPGLPD